MSSSLPPSWGPTHHRVPILTIALATVALATWAIPGADAALQYYRGAIAAGELWRLVTGHWAHWGADHLTWDLIVFAVFGALLERSSRRGFVAVVSGSALAISGALWFAAPPFEFYRGLSGIDSALFAAFFARLLRDAWRDRSLLESIVPVLALVGFVGKSAYELATGATLFVAASSTFTAVPLAHLVGAVAGVAPMLWTRAHRVDSDEVVRSIARPFLLLTFVGLTIHGCSSHRVPSIETLVRNPVGRLAHVSSRQVDLSEIVPYMRRAIWTDDLMLWKVSHRVVLSDGTRVRFEQFGAIFSIEGVDGTFIILDGDRDGYERVRDRLIVYPGQ